MDLNETVLLSAIASFGAGGYGFGYLKADVSWIRSIVKCVPVAAMAGIAAILGGPDLLVLGLALGVVGDFFLSRESGQAFLAGLGAFLLSHVAYILLFWSLRAEFIYKPMLMPMAGVIVFALIMSVFLWRKAADFRGPVLAYIAIVMLMVLSAMVVPLGHRLITLGALLFMLSDSVLAVERFALTEGDEKLKTTPAIVWWTYVVAQAAILLGVLGAASG